MVIKNTSADNSLRIAVIRQTALINLLLDKGIIDETELRNYTDKLTKEAIEKGAFGDISE